MYNNIKKERLVNTKDLLFLLKNEKIDEELKKSFAIQLLRKYDIKECGMSNINQNKESRVYLTIKPKDNGKPIRVNLLNKYDAIILSQTFTDPKTKEQTEIIYDMFFKPEEKEEQISKHL